MALYKGESKLTLFRGDQKPYAIYKGNKQITGAVRSEKQAEGTITWEAPYKAQIPSVTVTGQGKQGKLTGKNIANEILDGFPAIYSNTPTWQADTSSHSIVFDCLQYKGQTLTISSDGNRSNLAYCDTNKLENQKSIVYKIDTSNTPVRTFSVDSNPPHRYIIVQLSYKKDITKVQLELGTVSTSYEPYCGGIPAPNPEYPIEPEFLEGATVTDGTETANVPILRALPDGSVKDEIDLTTGKITRRVGEHIITPSETMALTEQSGNARIQIYFFNNIILSGKEPVCNYYVSDGFSPTSGKIGTITVGETVSRLWLWDDIKKYPTIGAYRKYLQERIDKGTPVKIWYALKEPVTEQVDPQILNQHMGYTVLECNKPAELKATVFEEFEK